MHICVQTEGCAFVFISPRFQCSVLCRYSASARTKNLIFKNLPYWLLIWKMCVEVKTTWILPFMELFLLCYPSSKNHNCLHWEGRAGSGFGGGIFRASWTHLCTHTHKCTLNGSCVWWEEKGERGFGGAFLRGYKSCALFLAGESWWSPFCVFFIIHGIDVFFFS